MILSRRWGGEREPEETEEGDGVHRFQVTQRSEANRTLVASYPEKKRPPGGRTGGRVLIN